MQSGLSILQKGKRVDAPEIRFPDPSGRGIRITKYPQISNALSGSSHTAMTYRQKIYGWIPLLPIIVLLSSPAAAQSDPSSIRLDLGSSWQARNKVQIPNDDQGDRFSLDDLAGDGPWATVRAEGIWSINEKHGVRIVLAPFSYTEKGGLDQQTRFAGASYSPDTPVKGRYTFNSWRVGYRYHLYAEPDWDFWVGGTLKVRDASIKLSQDGVSSQDDDVGVVPLLYLAVAYRFNEEWSIAADMDGLAGGPGRALDLGIRLNYDLNDAWQLGLGYRTLEGGADTDDVYNFAWFNTVSLSLARRF